MPRKRKQEEESSGYRLTMVPESEPSPYKAKLPDNWSDKQKANWLAAVLQARKHLEKIRGGDR